MLKPRTPGLQRVECEELAAADLAGASRFSMTLADPEAVS